MLLKIELVPKSSWYNNIRQYVSKIVWDKLRKEVYANAGYKCEICQAKETLHCHEKWEFDDVSLTQKLIGLEAICANCHMIHHAGFSMHTDEGKRKFNREDLIEHFCKVNNCGESDFYKHEDESFALWKQRSLLEWSVDFGDYTEIVNIK